jgi:small subunit ribosomal protein S16
MLVIRFFRVGKKNQPSFKIVVNEKRKSAKSGKFIEEVGFYNPLTKEKVLRKERILYWLSVGAKPSASVANLLISEKILEAKKIPKHKKAKEKKEEKPKETKEEKKEEKKEGVDKKV